MKPVFLSYRKKDSSDITGRMFDHLSRRFGVSNIFRDIDSIPPGADFRKTLRIAVQSCGVMVAVIGNAWLDAKDAAGNRRLDDVDDWVRIELEAALERDIPVIPALLGDAVLPDAAKLPDPLTVLTFRQATRVRPDPDFATDIERLARALESYLGTTPQESELQKTFRFSIELEPVSHGRRVDLGEPYGTVYAGGCKFRITLANTGTAPLTVSSMKFTSQWQPIDALALEKMKILYKGILLPHQLFIHLTKQGFHGWWLLSYGDRLSDAPRRFDQSAGDLFQSEGEPRLMFQIKPGEFEVIDGTMQPQDEGLYEVRLSALASNAKSEKSAKAMKPTRIAKVSFR